MSSRRARPGRVGGAACLGVEVTVEFDEAQFVGSGVLLLASVLERFLGMYASINSFTRLVATTRQREGVLKRWPPRAGETDPPLARTLFEEPYRFDFFQAVRLLGRLRAGREPVGGEGHPGREVVRFRARPSLAFPASEVHALDPPAEGDPGAPPR